MTSEKSPRIPKYRRQKRPNSTDQAFVELGGRRFYLSPYGSTESQQEYHRLIGEWIASGRQVPVPSEDLTITELIAWFSQHAQSYYRKPNGQPTKETANFRSLLRLLNEVYGNTCAAEFGPRGLKEVRQRMIDTGWSRTYINHQVRRLRHMFRWAMSQELVPVAVYQGLQAVAGLKRGRTKARETHPVKPVPDATVEATLRHLTPTLRAMVEVQRLSGMRSGEICVVRGCDLDTNGRVWIYRLEPHKTTHQGRQRLVFIGPKAQEILRPRLKLDTQAHLFSPADSEDERWAALHAKRETPLSCGNIPGSNRLSKPRRRPGERYTTNTYAQAIRYGCNQAKVHRWSPNQLRHSFATEVRREHGLELLGHAKADVTQVYAERDIQKAVDVASKIG